VAAGCTGYLASVHGLAGPVSQWTGGGTPLTAMLSCKREVDGTLKPQAKAADVDLTAKPYAVLKASLERSWEASEE
jgi:pyrophosphate--fructose-6-phosphate 1-phosphotransferase